MRNKKINKKQFTLIELIIVIVVIGILAAMALPKFIGVIRNAKVASMEQDLDVLEKAVMQYVMATADGSYPFEDLNGDDIINEEDLYFKTSNAPQSLKDSLLNASGDTGDNIYKLDMDKLKPYIDKIKYPNVDYVYSPDSDTAIDPVGRPDADDNIHHIIGGGITNEVIQDVIGYEVDWKYEETGKGLILTLYKKDAPETLIVPNKLKLEDGRIIKVVSVRGNLDNNSSNIFGKSNTTTTTKIIVSDGIEEISNLAFFGMQNLIEVELPKTLTKMYGFVFMSDPNLTKLDLPEKLIELGEGNFLFCGVKNLVIPNSVTTLHERSFEQGAFENIVIGTGITEIPPNTFSSLNKIKSITFAPNSNVKTIKEGAFNRNCTVEELVFPDSVETIETNGSSPFNYNSIKRITFGKGMTVIPENFFSGLSKLEKITFASTTKTINSTFSNLPLLKEIVFPDSVESFVDIGNSYFSSSGVETITFGSGITKIPNNFFMNATNLKTINFSDNSKIETIGNYAFSSCSNLETLNIPEGVKTIGSSAFTGSKIKTLILPNTLISIDKGYSSGPFSGTTIDTLKLGSGITEIPSNYFTGATIKTIILPEGITKIQPLAFQSCSGLINLVLPESLQSIENGALAGLRVENLTLPNSLTKTVNSTPLGGTEIKNLYLGSGLTELPDNFLQGITNLTTVNFSKDNKITKIGSKVFAGASKLTEIILPSNITSIDPEAFTYSYITKFNVVEGSYADTWCHNNGKTHTHIIE